MNTFPWTTFYILLAAAVLGGAAVLPYALAFNPQIAKLKESGDSSKPRPPFAVMAFASIVQTGILMGIAAFVGLLAGQQVGLGSPIIQAAVEGQPVWNQVLAMLPAAALLGGAAGAALLVLEIAYFQPRIPRELSGIDKQTAFWKRVLACFYGGINEEILMRLFVMTGLVWLLGLVWNTPAGVPAAGAFWVANILAALLFGAGHLPATRMTTKLTPVVVFRALLLNGIPGVAFGYLFQQYGLEAAMLAHFSLDIIVHLIAPPLYSRRLKAPSPGSTPLPA